MSSRPKGQASSRQLALLAEVMSSPRRYIIGIDEVGYGCIAGPLYVAGAVFLKGWGDPDVKDSKEYSGHSARRKVLITKIMPNVVHHMIAWASSEEIDANGLGRTVRKLHQRVAENCAAAVPDSLIIVDGVYQVAVAGVESYVFPKADSIVPAVSAASIIAKTARDEMMQVLAGKYPGYGFERHVGYGTEEHYTAIEQLGVCAIHRKTFGPIRRFIQHGVLTYSR